MQNPGCLSHVEKLVEGVRPADDPALAAHLKTCLDCFRTAADLRDPWVLTALRSDHLADVEAGFPGIDPGPAFWAGFPTQVARASRPAATRVTASWLVRTGVGGAVVGATAALVMLFLPSGLPFAARRPMGPTPQGDAPVVAIPSASGGFDEVDDSDDLTAPAPEVGLSPIEQIETLGVNDLKVIARRLGSIQTSEALELNEEI